MADITSGRDTIQPLDQGFDAAAGGSAHVSATQLHAVANRKAADGTGGKKCPVRTPAGPGCW